MSSRPANQKPKPAPFPLGARVKYIGTRRISIGPTPETATPVLFPGAEGSIVRIIEGRQGTGRHLRDEDGPMYYDDTGDPILDDTKDGYSVWVCDVDPRNEHKGRCIDPDPENLKEWELM